MTEEEWVFLGFGYVVVGAFFFFLFELRESTRENLGLLGCFGMLMMSFAPLLVMFLVFWPIWAPLLWWLDRRRK